MRGNVAYFTQLVKHLANPLVKWAFYNFLKNIQTYQSPAEFQNSIPNASAYREIRMLNAPLYLKWIVCEIKRGILYNDSVRNLYLRFKHWVKENKEGSEDHVITETAFGLLLNKSKNVGQDFVIPFTGDKVRRSDSMLFRWDIDSVISGLVSLYLLEKDFVYKPAENHEDDDMTELSADNSTTLIN
jgi:hypothetical protein